MEACLETLRSVFRRRPAVHQFHSGTAPGDAVTNSLFLVQDILRSFGFKSEIYAQHVAPQLRGRVKDYRSYRTSPKQTLLLHHSMGHDLDTWIAELRDRKILVYHNITPAHFFKHGSRFHKYSTIGRQQLESLKQQVFATISDSEYNISELKELGYSNTYVAPLLVQPEKIKLANWALDPDFADGSKRTILFVGRVCENKCQHDVIEVFRHVLKLTADHHPGDPFQLIFVGGYEFDSDYWRSLQLLIAERGLQESVRFVGKVSDELLYGWYRVSDVFVCMSEHEGFGVPLVEAMTFDLPVVAYSSSSIPATLAGAGILYDEKSHAKIAEGVVKVLYDKTFRRKIIASQRKRLEEFEFSKIRNLFSHILENAGIRVPRAQTKSESSRKRFSCQIEGPFETSYSLALVNRELGLALERRNGGTVSIFPTEGPGDYQPKTKDLRNYPEALPLFRRSRKGSQSDLVIRNIFPPRVHDCDGLLKTFYFFWEESEIPKRWIRGFNARLDFVIAATQFVKKTLIDNGLTIPVVVVGCGVDHILRTPQIPYSVASNKGFKFLHLSSGFPRKGLDVLLESYCREFNGNDDVSLIIKTAPNPHLDVAALVREFFEKHELPPEILVIQEDLSTGEILDLFKKSNALVNPTRGEGFGLPMAEAMALGIPTITTRYGGQSDFSSDETSWLVDYEFEYSKSHLKERRSVWCNPDSDSLARRMREVYEAGPADIEKKTSKAKKFVTTNLTWDLIAEKVLTMAETLSKSAEDDRGGKVGWVSTWNSKCGIASYSSFLLSQKSFRDSNVMVFASRKDSQIREDEFNVQRCWDDFQNPDLSVLKSSVLDSGVKTLIIQFNFGFYELKAMGNLIEELSQKGVKTIIVFHSTKDVERNGSLISLSQIANSLKKAARLLVHGLHDLNRMRAFGLAENTALFPHGVFLRPTRDLPTLRMRLSIPQDAVLIGSYGFLLPHKGTEELIRAFAKIANAHPKSHLMLLNALYPIGVSADLRDYCLDLIKKLGIETRVTMINDYLENEESLCILEALDFLVFPYQETGESSSAAVRFGLSANRPVFCTPSPIFEDVKEVVQFFDGYSIDQIAHGLDQVLSKPELRFKKAEEQLAWLEEYSWEKTASKMQNLITGLSAFSP